MGTKSEGRKLERAGCNRKNENNSRDASAPHCNTSERVKNRSAPRGRRRCTRTNCHCAQLNANVNGRRVLNILSIHSEAADVKCNRTRKRDRGCAAGGRAASEVAVEI